IAARDRGRAGINLAADQDGVGGLGCVLPRKVEHAAAIANIAHRADDLRRLGIERCLDGKGAGAHHGRVEACRCACLTTMAEAFTAPAMVARLPPVSSASAAVLILVPAFAVTVPE